MSLIQEWRALLKRPELPFIFAQLPNYTLEPDCDWPRLRDEQRRALTLWNTAMAVTEPGVRVAQGESSPQYSVSLSANEASMITLLPGTA